MAAKTKRDADGVTHSKPGTVDQQGEDSFPASDTPSYSPGAIGAPEGRHSASRVSQKTGPKKPAKPRDH